MLTFIPDDAYETLLTSLRASALATDWRGALAEALACVDVLPDRCRDDFAAVEEVATAA